MRVALLLIISIITLSFIQAQPINDNCGGAIELNLSSLFPCPFTLTSSNFFIYNNEEATAALPYPSFYDCGADPTQAAAEVWFSFVPNGAIAKIEIEGLQTPNFVIFQGDNCTELIPVFCASSEPDSSYVKAELTLEPLQQYYLMVAGEDPEDQGEFNIIFKNQRDCNPCLLQDQFTANPTPDNGTYQAGDTVEFCYTIEEWDISGTVEWPHSLEVHLGDGWDKNSLVATPPPSCDGNGTWSWYNEWVSCNSGQTFGPGFAYESSIGVSCGGSPLDDDPGNNWGDGSGTCAGIGTTAAPLQFCWTVVVDECIGLDNQTDLSIFVDLHSDGESGSWIQVGCNTLADFQLLASAVCTDTMPPFLAATSTSCPNACDGSANFAAMGPGPWNYDFHNADSSVFIEVLNTTDTVSIDSLCSGSYILNITDISTGNEQTIPVTIEESPGPVAMADNTGPACPGEQIKLIGSTSDTSSNAQYHWTGPDGFASNEQTPTLTPSAGNYVLEVTIDGCTSEPDTTMVSILPLPEITLLPDDTLAACAGDTIEVMAAGAASYSWESADHHPLDTGSTLIYVLDSNEVLTVIGTNASGCVDSTLLTLEVLPGPVVTTSNDTTICVGDSAIIEAGGGVSYRWSTGDTTATIEVAPVSSNSYSVTATDSNGCSSTAEITVTVSDDLAVNAGPDQSKCPGDAFAFTAVAQGGTPPYQFSWNDTAQTTSAFLFATPDTTTHYIVTVTDALGCTMTDEVTAQVLEPAFTVAASPPQICSGEKTTLSVENGTVVEWSTGSSNASIDVTPTETTTYSVTVLSSNNCLFTSEITVEVYPVPELPIITCDSEPETVHFTWTGVPDSFNIIVNTGQSAEIMGNQVVVTNLAPEETVAITMEVFTDDGCVFTVESSCTTPACPEFNLEIQPVAPICLIPGTSPVNLSGTIVGGDGDGTFLWSGPGVSQSGTFNPFEAGPGSHTIVLDYTEDNCGSSESITINVEAPLAPPVVSCSHTDIAVEFSWEEVPGAIGYEVQVISGQEGIRIGNVFTVVDLTPGDIVTIEVTALSDGICGNSSTEASCVALSCSALAIDLVDTVTVCHSDPPFSLPVTVTNGLGDGAYQWLGDCVSDPAIGLINPQSCGVGTHNLLVTYLEGNCTVTAEVMVEVLPPASAQFAATPTICLGNHATVIFTGQMNSGFDLQWDFDGGAANTGVGPGPHNVTWDTPGEKTISLTVEYNGCTAGPFTQTVLVQEELTPPAVVCEPGPGMVTFSDVPDPAVAPVSYAVTVNGEPIAPPVVEDQQLFIDGLIPGDTVALSLILMDPGPCDNVSATYRCVVEECPDVTIAIEQIPDLCLDGVAPSFILESEVVGTNMGGQLLWSGPGIVDSVSGLFNPNMAGIGEHQLTLSYEEGPCTYSTSSAITIVSPPQIGNVNVNCDEEGNNYYLSFEVEDEGGTYTVMSDIVPSGEAIDTSFTLEESCRPVRFDLVRSCDCANEAGQMGQTLQCGIGSVTAQYISSGNLGFMDLLRFYLHDNSGNVLGQVYAKSNFPTFAFNPNQMEYGQIYYISAVVGPNNGFGQIDLNDPCLSVSPGQPVLFSPSPTLTGAIDATICTGQSATFGVELPVSATVNWAPTTSLSCTDCPVTTASPTATTTYSAEVVDVSGCVSNFDVTVYVDEFPAGSFPDAPLTACTDKPFEFCLPAGVAYSWSGPDNFSLNNQCLFIPSYEPEMAGVYTAEITLSDGCVLTESIEVITDAPLVVNSITSDTSVCRFEFFTLTADVEGADHYVWFPAANVTCQNCQTTQAYINANTEFTLVALAESGCQITRHINVTRSDNCGGFDIFLTNGQVEKNGPTTVRLYPNPVSQELTINTEEAVLEWVEIYTLEGKLLHQLETNGHQQTLDVHDLTEGTYLARIRTDQWCQTKKFVVLR